MKQLLDPNSIERVLLFIAVGGPLMGVIIGALLGAHEKYPARRVIAGVLLGCTGSVIYGLWQLYGVITNILGLDSAVNLVLQLILFAVLGAMLGAVGLRVSVFLKRLRTNNPDL